MVNRKKLIFYFIYKFYLNDGKLNISRQYQRADHREGIACDGIGVDQGLAGQTNKNNI